MADSVELVIWRRLTSSFDGKTPDPEIIRLSNKLSYRCYDEPPLVLVRLYSGTQVPLLDPYLRGLLNFTRALGKPGWCLANCLPALETINGYPSLLHDNASTFLFNSKARPLCQLHYSSSWPKASHLKVGRSARSLVRELPCLGISRNSGVDMITRTTEARSRNLHSKLHRYVGPSALRLVIWHFTASPRSPNCFPTAPCQNRPRLTVTASQFWSDLGT